MIEGPDSLRSPQTDSLRSRPQETHLEHHFSTHLGHHRPHFCDRVVTGGHSLRSPNQTYYKPAGLDMGTWGHGVEGTCGGDTWGHGVQGKRHAALRGVLEVATGKLTR